MRGRDGETSEGKGGTEAEGLTIYLADTQQHFRARSSAKEKITEKLVSMPLLFLLSSPFSPQQNFNSHLFFFFRLFGAVLLQLVSEKLEQSLNSSPLLSLGTS